jgi:flagellar motor switch protein FliN
VAEFERYGARMNSPTHGQTRLDDDPKVRQVVDAWAEGLAQVVESMADQKPEVGWRAAAGPLADIGGPAGPGAESEILWWEQPFQRIPAAAVWIGTPRAAWEYTGALTLRAAGLETIEPGEARNTWLEILGQSLAVMARAIGAQVGREVNCDPGVERAPVPEASHWGLLTLSLPEATLAPLIFTFSPALRELIATPAEPGEEAPAQTEPGTVAPVQPEAAANSRTMELLLDVDLPVSVSFGKAQLPLKDVLKLTTGSIVELNRGVNDHVEVLVNHCLIARGEVVVVEGNYGVRIQQIASRQDRLRSFS